MGNQQPKKIGKASKTQIQVACLKAKFHLQIMRDRKNGQIIKGQKQLVGKINSPHRNKAQQILIAERIINGLKYAQACNQLMAYATSLKGQANFLSQNMMNPQKIQPYLMMIYSLIYAAEHLGLSSLKQFQAIMKALNDPMNMPKYVNPQIVELLAPQPTPYQLNTYFIQMSERNNIQLQKINIIGHKFSRNFDGISGKQNQNYIDPSFSQIQRKLGEQLKKNMGGNQNHIGGNQKSMGGNQNQGFNPIPPGSMKPEKNLHDSNPYGFFRESFNDEDPNKFGPGLFIPQKVQQKKQIPQPYNMDSRFSIKSINDIDYYPQIDGPKVIGVDADFNQLCQKIKTGL